MAKYTQFIKYEYATEYLNINPNANFLIGAYGVDGFDSDNCVVYVQKQDTTYITYLTEYNGMEWRVKGKEGNGVDIQSAVDDLLVKNANGVPHVG